MRIYRIRRIPAKLVLFILITAIIAFSPKIRLSIKTFALDVLAKPLGAFSSIRERMRRREELSDENLLLKEHFAMLSLELARMKEIASENKRLRRLLDFKKDLTYKGIIAKVIARDSTDWRRGIIINKGKSHGIKERMMCATAKGVIGSVSEAGLTTSKVTLITDPSSRLGVIFEPSRESGVLVGLLHERCKVIYLSLDSEIKKGERVLTGGFSAFFPKGFLVGRVLETGVEKAKLYKYAIVDPIEEMGRVEEVVCIDAR